MKYAISITYNEVAWKILRGELVASRYTYIDIAKGIGILSIVLGHNYVVAHKNGELWNVLYSFNVPLFFFLSGLFINPNYGLRGHIIKRVDSYLKPYFVTLLLLGTIIIPFDGVDAVKYFAKILYGAGPGLPWGWVQLWFLPHLFAVSVFSYLCFFRTNLMYKSFLFKITSLIIILSIGFLGIDYFWNIPVFGMHTAIPGLPFSIDLILLCSFYFLLGIVLKQEVLSLKFNLGMFLLFIFVFAFIHLKYNYTIDLNMRRYDNIIICTIASIVGIYIVISISRLLQDTPIISNCLSYIGSASLFILLFHNYVQLKTIMFLKASLSGNKYIIIPIIAFVSFSMAVLVPLMLYELVKRNTALRMIFLPIKSNPVNS